MPNYQALSVELTTDPTGLGYAGKTHAEAAALLNGAAVTTQVERTLVPGYEVWEAIVPAEWAALTAGEKQRVQTIVSMDPINLRGSNTRASLAAAFGPGTVTRANLNALQTQTITQSRAEMIFGVTPVTEFDVAHARSL